MSAQFKPNFIERSGQWFWRVRFGNRSYGIADGAGFKTKEGAVEAWGRFAANAAGWLYEEALTGRSNGERVFGSVEEE